MAHKHDLVECINRKKEEIEEQQRIENTMNRYQHIVICTIAGAIHIVLDTFALNVERAIENLRKV